jgi:plasmid replication initiation protein
MSKKKQIPTIDSDIKLIRKANEFVEARYKFDIWETRVFAHMLTLIKFNDTDFVEYRISVSDIVKMFGLTKSGEFMKKLKASEKLLNKRVQIERTSPEGIVEIVDTYLVVSTARPKEATKDNYIKLRFHSDLKPFLLELKQRYLVYDIRNILSLTSIYSVRLFELLKQYQKIGKRRFELDELKSLLSIEPNEYALYGHFKERVIKKAQKDLKQHTDIYFEFEEETEKKRVYAIVFGYTIMFKINVLLRH